jgi:hypothetical protein
VEALGRVEGNLCCIRYTIVIATQTGSTVDVDKTAATMRAGLGLSGDFVVEGEEGPTETRGNSAIQLGFSLMLLFAIYLLF